MEEDKVTIQKPKNPGRVEWGRKLGKLSKQKKIENEAVPSKTDEQSYMKYYKVIICGVGVIIFLCAYKCKFKKCQKVTVCNSKERTFVNF